MLIYLQHSELYKPTGSWSSILTYVVLLVVIISIPNFAVAHEESHEKWLSDFKEPPAGMMACLMPTDEMMAELPPFSLEATDLTETQHDNIFQIMHSLAPSLHEKKKAIRKTMELLQQLATSDQFDATKARLIADEHAKALADLFYIHAETQAKVWKILTDEQRKHLIEKFEPHVQKQ